DVLELAGAGMPPALIVREATGAVEAVALKGMPLGSPAEYPYASSTVRLHPGDAVVLMSDGFPELFDARGAMLGYEPVAEHVRAGAGGSAEDLIGHLRRTMDAWTDGHSLRDDVTFLVLRRKPQRVTE